MSETQTKVIERLQVMDRISLGFTQYTRDMVDDCLEIATNVQWYMPRFEEKLGSQCYLMGTVLDIMKPEFEEDIAILKEIISLFKEWQSKIEQTQKI